MAFNNTIDTVTKSEYGIKKTAVGRKLGTLPSKHKTLNHVGLMLGQRRVQCLCRVTSTVPQSQKAVSTYITGKQIQSFGFAWWCNIKNTEWSSRKMGTLGKGKMSMCRKTENCLCN